MLFLIIMAIPLPTQFAVDLPTINLKKIDMKQIACMARNIYYEAGAEAMPGQAAVARVVMNRINHGFAETPCKVIYQKTTINEGNFVKCIMRLNNMCDNLMEICKNLQLYGLCAKLEGYNQKLIRGITNINSLYIQ